MPTEKPCKDESSLVILLYSTLSSAVSPYPPSFFAGIKKKEKKIMRKEAERRLREQDWGREIRGGGALECSCNQGLCAQEGPINPAVWLYISSGILKAAKNESPGPGGLLGAAERESERATGGFGQESVITAAEDTSHDRPESLSCSRPGK